MVLEGTLFNVPGGLSRTFSWLASLGQGCAGVLPGPEPVFPCHLASLIRGTARLLQVSVPSPQAHYPGDAPTRLPASRVLAAMSIYHCNVIKAMTGSIENFLQQLERVILCLLDIRIKMLVLNFYAFLFSSISFLLYCTKVLIYNRLEVKNNNNSVTGPPYECLQIDCSRLPSSSLGQTGFCLRYTFEI